MKKAILLLFVLPALAFTAKAQIGYNYAQYSLGVGVNYVSAKTDVPYPVHNPAVNFSATFNQTPYTSFTLQYEFGLLAGGYSSFLTDAVKKGIDPNNQQELAVTALAYSKLDPYGRYYSNRYQSVTLIGDMQFGEFMDYSNDGFFDKVLRNIYIGTGLGMVYNNITDVGRYNDDKSYAYGGSDHSTNILVPVRAGYQFKIYNAYDEPSVLLEFGYQMNYVFGYGLDGYSDPKFTTRNFERYGGYHVGLKFNFGNVTSYRKAVH